MLQILHAHAAHSPLDRPMLHGTLSGSMSMWASTHDTLVAYKSEGSACKFADRKMGGLTAVV